MPRNTDRQCGVGLPSLTSYAIYGSIMKWILVLVKTEGTKIYTIPNTLNYIPIPITHTHTHHLYLLPIVTHIPNTQTQHPDLTHTHTERDMGGGEEER